MLNQLFILALLTPIVFCRSSFEDRQWNADDVREYDCITNCTSECPECHQPNKCDEETEIACDCVPQVHADSTKFAYELIINCPCHEICIPKHCECQVDDCPMICEVTCEDDEILCPGGTDSEGCRENDFCHPKGTGYTGDICPGYCPFECDDDELRCPVPNDPVTGCEVPPLCIPKVQDNSGNDCEYQQCPLLCDIFSDIFCPGFVDHIGCPKPDSCVPKCVEECPVECTAGEIMCKGPEMCDECVKRDECKPIAKNINGEPCPADSASHECEIICCGDTVLCPGEPDGLGCLAPSTCEPTSTGMDNSTCPDHSDCPTICEPYEVKCPVTDTDDNGCKLADECILQERDYDGDLCTVHCPLDCDEEDETYCPGQRNQMGCFEQDQCITRPIKTKGSDVGGLCPGWCPPVCKHGQIKCPSQVDPCDGCPTEEICVDIAVNLDGLPCSANLETLSASHHCPVICDYTKGDTTCPPKTLPDDCETPIRCHERPYDNDGQWCPAHSVCPSTCTEDEITCTYGIDARGCQEAPLCRARGTDLDGELCPGVCPPTCSADETLTSQQPNAKGCEVASICVPKV